MPPEIDEMITTEVVEGIKGILSIEFSRINAEAFWLLSFCLATLFSMSFMVTVAGLLHQPQSSFLTPCPQVTARGLRS